LKVHSSLLNVVLYDKPQLRRWTKLNRNFLGGIVASAAPLLPCRCFETTAISFELMDEQKRRDKGRPEMVSSRAVMTVMNAGNVRILRSGSIIAVSTMPTHGGLMRQVLMSILPVGISGGANAATDIQNTHQLLHAPAYPW